MNYQEFYVAATGWRPFDFQMRFRETIGTRIILKAPTGLGKTEAVLVAWLHRRAMEQDRTPRRLIWCLPSRALTEQVAQVAEACIERLVQNGLIGPIRVCRLLGGSADNDITLQPDDTAVLVATLDIALSRALNRGYARTPFRWPIDFGLLNNDCAWVMDEVQLLGDGLATSTQMSAFREKFGVFGAAQSCWISATLDPTWLKTVDFDDSSVVIEPDVEDLKNEIVGTRVGAEKGIERADEACRLPSGVAALVAAQHRAGTLTLVVANTVRRAVEIRRELEGTTDADLQLLHSRFRAADRKEHVAAVFSALPAAGRIVVATQVIEAGLDLDASLMVTDLAPYANMVQRFGRVNRRGERRGCRIFWVDRPLTAKRKGWANQAALKEKESTEVYTPYDATEASQAAEILSGLRSAAPRDLPKLNGAPTPWKHVLRRADILDLFDTSPDLGGNQVDISRFVRSDPDRDVYVAWRDWDGVAPPPEEIDDKELCPAPIGDLDKVPVWNWNATTGEWMKPSHIYPGLTLLMHVKQGKYSKDYGWLADSKSTVTPIAHPDAPLDKLDADGMSFPKYRQTLEGHTQQVCDAMKVLLEALRNLGMEPYRAAMEEAARRHDWGKAHPVMQQTLQGSSGPYTELLGKSAGNGNHSRPYFRHELASAMAMLAAGASDLAAYVIAAHHGKIRVSIRSMPGERDSGAICIRGLRQGDELLECVLGGGDRPKAIQLNLEPVMMGEGSWTERALRLRDELGPFRLAYLEMVLRAADEAASKKGGQ